MEKKSIQICYFVPFLFYVFTFSSCMEPRVTTRIINIGDNRTTKKSTSAYVLECDGWNTYFDIPDIPEGSGYTTLNVEWTWKSPNGTEAFVQLGNDDYNNASSSIYHSEQDTWLVTSGKCLAGAFFQDWTKGGDYSKCADTATRLCFYIQDRNNNWNATYGIVYIRKIWLSGWNKEWVLFEATDYYEPSYQIDYTDYRGSNCSIIVRNDSIYNVVCFHNTPSTENMISGVKAGCNGGLKKNSLFNVSHDFVLFVVKEEDYLAYKNNLSALKSNPFAMLYAYYNTDSGINTNVVYNISPYMGGQYYILLNNITKYNVELRQNGLYGEPLAFYSAYTTQTKINMKEGDYEVFPVFRKFSKRIGEIITSYPSYKYEGNDWPIFFNFSFDQNFISQEFNTQDWFNGDMFNASEKPGYAYVSIHNGNTGTSVSLYRGANAEASITSTGGKTINGGKTLAFEIPMLSLGRGKYSTSVQCAGLRIGTSIQTEELPQATLKDKKIYYLDVGGSSYYDITAKWRTYDGIIVSDYISFDDE